MGILKKTCSGRPSTYSAKCLYRTLDGKSLDANSIDFINQQLQNTPGIKVSANAACIEDLKQFKIENPYHLAHCVYEKTNNHPFPVINIGFFKGSPNSQDQITFYRPEAPLSDNGYTFQ